MAKNSPIQFKGTTLKIIQVQLRDAELATLRGALADITGNSPDFFENELAVLDFSPAESLPERIDWAGLIALLAASGLHAVAVCGLPDGLMASARAARLPGLDAAVFNRRPPRPAADSAPAAAAPTVEAAPPVAPAPVEPPPAPAPSAPVEAPPPSPSPSPSPAPATVILDKPLRSGQRYYAKGCDLIVTAMVSAGAEVIADGNIHVYAPLRGRALAGASGDRAARIFTTSLEAELVSVAGLYRTFEAGVPNELLRRPATVSLLGEGENARLDVAPLELR